MSFDFDYEIGFIFVVLDFGFKQPTEWLRF